MSSLENAFRNAVANANDQRGKPAILGKSDGTLYWVDPSGMTHRTRVWARIGEQASNQEVVVDCLRASPQMDMPVRVDYVNGRMTVVDVDGQRAIEFGGGRPGASVAAHAWLHNRLGPDPVFIEGLQFLPLLVTPTSPPDLTVTVQAGAYTDDAGDLAIHDTAVSSSFSAFVPGTGHHFVIVCLDRTDGSIVLVDGSDVTVEDALFGDAVVTAADIEAVTISDDYKTLGAVLLYAGQTQIKARDIIKDLRTDGGAGGGGTPGGIDGQIQYNNGGGFGGFGVWDDVNNQLLINGTTPAFSGTVAEFHDTATAAVIAIVNDTASADANITATSYYLKNSSELQTAFGYFSVGSVVRTNGSESGYFDISVMNGGSLASMIDMRPSAITLNPDENNTDVRISGNGVTNGYFYDAGNNRHGFGTGSPNTIMEINDASPVLRLANNSTTSYLEIIDVSGTQSILRKISNSGAALIDIDPTPNDGTSNALFRFFRSVNTSGEVAFRVYRGNNTATTDHTFLGNGGYVCGNPTGGNKGVGTANFSGDIYKNNSAYNSPDFVPEHHFTGEIKLFSGNPGAEKYAGLLPLRKLEEFMRQNFCLPGRSNEPMGIFERSDLVQQWIEELAIYITQLHKRVKDLENGKSN